MKRDPLLTICIPIYNRQKYLERQLARFYEDKELIGDRVQLVVVDNCSDDDLHECCINYEQRGLHLQYHRHKTNIGPDGNFEWCFYHSEGKYTWLLGSDDILRPGVLQKVVGALESVECGLFHLSMRQMPTDLTVFHSSDEMAVSVNYWITFLSANIIRTESLKDIDLSRYRQSFMIQVPAYLNACYSYPDNAVFFTPNLFERDDDSKNNGGYNIFEVFVTNLYGIYTSFIAKGTLSRRAFNRIKKIEYKEFLLGFVIRFLVFKEKSNFSIEGGWSRLLRYYWNKGYFYLYLVYASLRKILGMALRRR